MSPALNGSFALQRGNAVELRNGIMFDFYLELPHMLASRQVSKIDGIVRGLMDDNLCFGFL